jgi:hypothetical protein
MLAHEFFPPDARETRILDFDIENRPLSYWMADRPTAEITAIAWMWHGDHDSLTVALLEPGEDGPVRLLEQFLQVYEQADLVTGHYIRKHDLPIINGALYELDMPMLGSKRTHDTKLDMFVKADVPATQEFLLEQLQPTCPIGIAVEKRHMSQRDWREANRLTPEGLCKTAQRVMSDVHSHWHMYDAMLERGWLRPPRIWDPGGGWSEVTEGRHR